MISQPAHFEQAPRFKERVQAWAAKLRVRPRQIRLQKMPRKWASCSTGGWVTFSNDLLREPHDFQDYVIVHELLHLRGVRNHGKLFKSLVRAHLSGSRGSTHGCVRPSHTRRQSPPATR
jgi:predicted metal-dependent hydrolase